MQATTFLDFVQLSNLTLPKINQWHVISNATYLILHGCECHEIQPFNIGKQNKFTKITMMLLSKYVQERKSFRGIAKYVPEGSEHVAKIDHCVI